MRKTIIAIGAILITAIALWYTNRVPEPTTATWDDVVTEAKRGDYRLIQFEELKARYEKDPGSLFLVDTRQAWEYRTGNIKGAVNFPIEPTWLSRWRKKGELETLLGKDKNRFIVFY